MKKQTGSLEMVRQLNLKLVLDTIRDQEPVSRAQISKQLKLSRSTVSQIVDWLIEKGKVYEVGVQSCDARTLGRPGQMLRFNPTYSHIVGMQLRGSEVTVCIADMRGRPLSVTTYPPAFDAKGVYDVMRTALDAAGIGQEQVARLSVSVPGAVNTEGKVLRATRLKWRNYDLPGQFRAFSPLPIDVNNDVNLALIGERRFGIGREHENLVYIHLGVGVGCGVMAGGKLVLGSTFMAGEIQYLSFGKDAQGTRDQLENMTGMNRFSHYPGGFAGLVQRYTMGEAESTAVVVEFIRTLSLTIAFICSLLDPSLIIIGGGMSAHMGDLMDDVRDGVRALLHTHADICLAGLEDKSCLMGAVARSLEIIEQA